MKMHDWEREAKKWRNAAFVLGLTNGLLFFALIMMTSFAFFVL